MPKILGDRRVILTLVLALAQLGIFWLGSRYPQLSEKAAMGGGTSISGLAFDTLFEVLPDSGFAKTVLVNTVNWLFTNWKGMAFGVLFGATLLTGLSLFRRRSFNQPFADAALGATIGTPLGVCVNCAAPIAQGLQSAGTRLETTLAALIASPTLNVIVVSMSFALLPTFMAAAKLLMTLAFILIVIPLLCRYLFAKEQKAASDAALGRLESDGLFRVPDRLVANEQFVAGAGQSDATWSKALWWLLSSYTRHFLFLFKVTVPLMILAGALGAFVISIVPVSLLLDYLDPIQGALLTIIVIGLITVVAMFLPVPIAFDVILSTVLVGAGVPAKFVLPILLGLGSFSVYSFLIIGRAISFRVSAVLTLGLATMAFFSGIYGHYAERTLLANSLAVETEILRTAEPPTVTYNSTPGPALVTDIASGNDTQKFTGANFNGTTEHLSSGSVHATITELGGNNASANASKFPFLRLTGSEVGLTTAVCATTWKYSSLMFTTGRLLPVMFKTTAGTISFWQITRRKVVFHFNANAGGKFVRKPIDLPFLGGEVCQFRRIG